MASWSEISDGIAAQFADTGLRYFGYMPENIDPPVIVVDLTECSPATMRHGWFVGTFEAYILTSSASDRTGQGMLDEFSSPAGTKSVWTVFGHNNDLDLTDGTRATLVKFRSLGLTTYANNPYFGGVLDITVTTPGV